MPSSSCVARREGGTRVYALAAHPPADDSAEGRARRAAALVALVVAKYAPLPATSLTHLVYLLGYGAPHLAEQARAALRAAREQLASVRLDGVTWYWPADENPRSARHEPDEALRLLAPFDPIVWDRTRFELLWGWRYRFEAYTPPAQRTLGYYALPLLWRDRVLGWANVTQREGALDARFGWAQGRAPRDAARRREREAELERLRAFLVAGRTRGRAG